MESLVNGYYYAGICYLKMGDRDLARSIFSNILAILPSHKTANLGYVESQ